MKLNFTFMKRSDFTIRLTLIPSQLDPGRSKVRATLRLCDGRRFYFTAKSSVDTLTAKLLFDSTGRPFNVEKYDKKVYAVMRGLYNSIIEAMLNLLGVECYEVAELTREQVKAEIRAELATWNKRHAGEGAEA